MAELSSVASNGCNWCQLSSSSSLSASGAAAVIETCVGMSCRCAVREKVCVLCCCKVRFGAVGSGNVWHALGRVIEVRGLALLTGLQSKVAMVMMTLLAFLVEIHIA